MTIEEAIYAHLMANAEITALIGNRLYPAKLPPKKVYPSVTYFKVSDVPQRTFGKRFWTRPRFQFSIRAESYSEAKQIKNKLKAVLDNYAGLMGGTSGVWVKLIEVAGDYDDNDPDTGLTFIPIDFFIWHVDPSLSQS